MITLACAYREYPYVVLHRLRGGTCVTATETPFGWKRFATVTEAGVEYDAHAGAEARVIVSTYDGTVLVYWTKPEYVTK